MGKETLTFGIVTEKTLPLRNSYIFKRYRYWEKVGI